MTREGDVQRGSADESEHRPLWLTAPQATDSEQQEQYLGKKMSVVRDASFLVPKMAKHCCSSAYDKLYHQDCSVLGGHLPRKECVCSVKTQVNMN